MSAHIESKSHCSPRGRAGWGQLESHLSCSTTEWLWRSVLVAQSCPTLCDPMDCSLPSSSVHGILQDRILEWISIPFSRGSSQPRDQSRVSCITCGLFTIWATREAPFLSKNTSNSSGFLKHMWWLIHVKYETPKWEHFSNPVCFIVVEVT